MRPSKLTDSREVMKSESGGSLVLCLVIYVVRHFTRMRLALHYNPNCPVCVRQAKRTARLDWLRTIDLTTEISPIGEVPIGEIVVVDKKRRQVFSGIYAT